jgi:hypothetical protein
MATLLESIKKPFLAVKDTKREDLSIPNNNDNIEQNLSHNDDDTNGLTYGFFDQGGTGFFSNGKGKDDFSAKVTRQNELVREYRRTANLPEVSNAIDEIVNEMAFVVDNDSVVYLDFKDIAEVNDKIKEAFTKNFEEVLTLLDFEYTVDSLVRKFYIDGRLVMGVSFDNKNLKKGINNIKIMSPINFVHDAKINKYRYFFDQSDFYARTVSQEEKDANVFDTEEIVCVDSGIYQDDFIMSYLDVAIKTANQLQTLEDLLIPLRFSRSISRRVFNVDMGDLPFAKAKQELNKMQNEFKYKKYYNVEKGTISNSSTIASIVEDYWFPNRNGNKGTVVDVLNETQNLGETGDITYFKQKLYEALKVPMGRIGGTDKGNVFDFSGTQIENDELKFFAMVNRLRQRFNVMFVELLRRHMIAKGIITAKEFEEYRRLISIKWEKENNFLERQRIELFKSKIDLYTQVKDLEGDVYSRKYMLKNVLGMSDEEIEQMKKEIAEEALVGGDNQNPDEEVPTDDTTDTSAPNAPEDGTEAPTTGDTTSSGGAEMPTDGAPTDKEFGNNFSATMKK